MSEAAAAAGFSRLLSDERLTRRAVGGDQRAFAAIFRRYHQELYRFCLAIVASPDDAQEALQNTMAKVLRALPGEARKIELKPWLYRIAHNESIDLLRRRRETRELDVEQIAPGYGLAEDVATRERLRRLLDDLQELPERQREVLVMRELSGFEFAEIGTALGTSGAVARQTLYEARQSLRQMDEGREMSCESVAKALSDGDGRITRRRDVRAHLRSCPGCRRFREEIESRQHDLAALSPLPAVATAGILQSLLGGSQGAGGSGLVATLGGGAAKSLGASAAVKGVATVAVVATIGVTAADKSGVIHLGLPGDRSSRSSGPASAGASEVEARGPQGPSGVSAGADKSHSAAIGSGAGGSQNRTDAGANRRSPGATAPAHHVQGEANTHGDVDSAPATEHSDGRDDEKQHPTAGSEHREAAGEHAPPQREADPGSQANEGNQGDEGDQEAPAPQPPAQEPPAQAAPTAGVPTQVQPQGDEGNQFGAGKGKGSEKGP